ncbi:MAG: hypothetical protein ACLVIR_14130, partial [Clostridium sp.]
FRLLGFLMTGNRSPAHQTPEGGAKCGNSNLFCFSISPNYAILISKAPFQANKYGLDRSVSNGI